MPKQKSCFHGCDDAEFFCKVTLHEVCGKCNTIMGAILNALSEELKDKAKRDSMLAAIQAGRTPIFGWKV